VFGGVIDYFVPDGFVVKILGKRTAIWLPIVTVPQILLLGMWFNTLS